LRWKEEETPGCFICIGVPTSSCRLRHRQAFSGLSRNAKGEEAKPGRITGGPASGLRRQASRSAAQ
jgi:hypothetical protein